MPTAYEIASARQVPLSMGIFGAVLTDAPAISRFDARPITGTKYRTLATVSLPDASPFVAYGQGFSLSYGRLGFRQADCQLFGGMIGADTISSKAWDQENSGAAGSGYFELQAMMKFQADMLNMERQLFYGLGRNALGFPGLKDVTPYASGNLLALGDSADETDYTKTVINAGGTTDNTATSIYAVRYGELDAQLIIGGVAGEGEMVNMGEIIKQMMAPDAAKPDEKLEFELQQFHGYIGLAVAGHTQQAGQTMPVQFCVRRVANVTKDSTHTNNDTLMNALVQSFPDNKIPSEIFMSRRSGQQLANSKSSTTVTFLAGTSSAQNARVSTTPPPPDNWEGIPICYTRAIRNDDALLS